MVPRRPRLLRTGLRVLLLAAGGAVSCATWTDLASLSSGERAYLEGRYSDAELIWLEALSASEIAEGEDPRLAESLRMLSNLYIQQERYEEARDLLERWMNLRERNPLADDGTLADGIDALAGIRAIQGEFESAARLYEMALRARETDAVIDNIGVAETLEHLAAITETLGRREESILLYRRAVEIREHALGLADSSLANSLHALAVIHHDRGRYGEAEALYRRALDLGQGTRLDRSLRGDRAHESG